MNIKEQIKEILETESDGWEVQADQILNLVLNALTIEKETTIGVGHSYRMDGFNECVDQLEALKTKLRK